MGFDRASIRRHLKAVATAQDTDEQGKAYEALAVHLFESVPGCLVEPNVLGVFKTEQIDVAVGVTRAEGGFALLPEVILVECKDWVRGVDSSTLGYFINILQSRAVKLGILVAANGITGKPDEFTNAHALGLSALTRGMKIVVLTTDDISSLTCYQDLVELIHRRYLRAVASGGIGAP